MAKQNITFPPGRLVWGSLYKAITHDRDGRPLVYASGPDTGKARVKYDFGVAIPKIPGHTHWSQSPWGAILWQEGHRAVPNANVLPDFAWKITDGDSAVVKQKAGQPPGPAPRDKEGYPGHWVVAFSSSFAPKIFDGLNGLAPLPQPDYVNPGDWVQVAGNTEYNGANDKPGIYINHDMVCFSGYGKRIQTGANPNAVGFQAGAVAGASVAPIGGIPAPLPPGVPAAQVPAPVPGYAPAAVGTPPPPMAYAAPVAPAPAPVAVAPNPAYAPPAPPAAVPQAPAAAPALAPGVPGTYADYIAAGWTHETLRAHNKLA